MYDPVYRAVRAPIPTGPAIAGPPVNSGMVLQLVRHVQHFVSDGILAL